MTTAYPHEAWCPRCHVSHPPGTRRCLHCGHDVMPARPGGANAGMTTHEIERFPSPEPADEEVAPETPRAARPLRIGFATLWLLLALAGAILRTCAERG